MKKSPCETCPKRLPMDGETWQQIKAAQRQATPQLSRKENLKLTQIERKTYEGIEANVEKCEGYSPFAAFANHALKKVWPSLRLKTTEAGGTRYASPAERTCNNPFLESEEYFKLQDEFQNTGKDANPNWGQDQRVYGAMAATSGAFAKTMLGLSLITGSELIPRDNLLEDIAGVPVMSAGLYLLATGVVGAVKGQINEVREMRAAKANQQQPPETL